MLRRLLFLMIVFSSFAETKQGHTTNLQQIDRLYQYSGLTDLTEWSAYFLGKRYELDPLGEGQQALFDRDPLYRIDAFDCLTYVETVMALSFADNALEFSNVMSQLRYKNTISFLERNHFTSVDWNKNNANKGYITDVTPLLNSKDKQPLAKVLTMKINKPAWYQNLTVQRLQGDFPRNSQQNQLAKLRALSQQTQTKQVTMPFIPLSVLFDKKGQLEPYILRQIPQPAIIEIVRYKWPIKNIGTSVLVSHLGFALREQQGIWIFRHASNHKGAIVDESLQHYLHKLLSVPSVAGIAIFAVNDQ